jgi:tetratricopeptide (TPR) repeat protein
VDAAVRTYREVVGHWKTNAFARSGLAKLLMQRRHPGDHEEAESLLRDSTRLFPDEVFLWTALAELLKDLGRYDEAAEVAYASVRQFPGNPVCCNILGEVRFIQGLKQGGDMALKEEARKWFEKAAELGDYHARQRLETLDSRWNRQIDRHGEGAAVPGVRQRELMQRRLKFEATESRWSPAQRLGRALLAQGQALRASNPAQKAELFERAKRLLLLSDQEADEYLSAFIEARGFLLLAQGKAQEALGYFKEQMDCYGRAAWAGVQLGYAEARLRTGEVVSPSEWRRLSALGPDGAVTSLVARVVLWLADEGDEELRSALLELYPQAAQAPHPDDETSRPSSLLLGWVNERWFKPAGIAQQADLHDAAKLADVRQLAKASAPELQQPFESVQLALAA